MRKRNLKAMFLALLARRLRRGGNPPSVESAESDKTVSPAHADTTSVTGDTLPQKPPGPPEDWLAKRSGGPPAHWVERVRQAAPELLQDRKKDEVGATLRPQPPGQVQRKPATPATMRLQRPAFTPSSSREAEQSDSGVGYAATDSRGRLEFQKHEPSPTYFSVNAQERDVEPSGRQGTVPLAPTQIVAPEGRRILAGGRTAGNGDRAESVATHGQGNWADAVPVLLPPANIRRPSGTKPHLPTYVSPNGLAQSSLDSDEREAPRGKPPAYENINLGLFNDEREASPSSLATPEAPAHAGKFSRRKHREQEQVVREIITRYPDVIHREARRDQAGHERLVVTSGYRKPEKREGEVTWPIEPPAAQDRRAASYDIPADRWPALIGASSADYFDDAMDAWRELSHRRRLSREQEGSLWSE